MTVRIAVVEQQHQLGELYDLILTRSFPERELVSLAHLEDSVASGESIVVAASDDDGWLGVAVLEKYAVGTFLLAYLAVGEAARGKGIGDGLLTAVKDIVGRERAWLLAEIEPPGAIPERPEFGDPARRANFYHRAGGKALAMNHWQPPVTDGGAFVRLQLIVLPSDGALGNDIDAAELLAFEREYHEQAGESAELREVVASVGNRQVIALRDLSELYS